MPSVEKIIFTACFIRLFCIFFKECRTLIDNSSLELERLSWVDVRNIRHKKKRVRGCRSSLEIAKIVQ